MSLKLKEKTIFSQKAIKRNVSKEYETIRKSLSDDDAVLFFMLKDTISNNNHKMDIEKIHKNVFQKAKIAKITISEADIETLEIMLDPKMKKEIKSRIDDIKKEDMILWDKIKKTS